MPVTGSTWCGREHQYTPMWRRRVEEHRLSGGLATPRSGSVHCWWASPQLWDSGQDYWEKETKKVSTFRRYNINGIETCNSVFRPPSPQVWGIIGGSLVKKNRSTSPYPRFQTFLKIKDIEKPCAGPQQRRQSTFWQAVSAFWSGEGFMHSDSTPFPGIRGQEGSFAARAFLERKGALDHISDLKNKTNIWPYSSGRFEKRIIAFLHTDD